MTSRALAYSPQKVLTKLNDCQELEAIWEDGESIIWLDLENPTPEELLAAQRLWKLDDEGIEDCLLGEQRPRIDDYEEYLFLILYDVKKSKSEERELEPLKCNIFWGNRFLLTVHERPIEVINSTWKRSQRRNNLLFKKGIDFLLFTLVDNLVDHYVKTAEEYEHQLDELEERSLNPDLDDSILEIMLDYRRDLLELRRISVSEREMLTPITRGEYDDISEGMQDNFRHVLDHLTRTIELIDNVRELLHGIRDNYHASLAIQANRVMQKLTVYAGIMLPLSVIAGIYGMNLRLWPAPESDWGFIVVVLMMLFLGVMLFGYFKKIRWL